MGNGRASSMKLLKNHLLFVYLLRQRSSACFRVFFSCSGQLTIVSVHSLIIGVHAFREIVKRKLSVSLSRASNNVLDE